MYSKKTKVINGSGIHARPASDFAVLAKSFEASVTIKNLDEMTAPVNAKSVVRLLAGGFDKETNVEISANGSDERQAVDALVALIERGFGE